MKSIGLLTLITTFYVSTTWAAPYFAKAEINLSEVTSAKELASILPNLSQAMTLNGNARDGRVYNCEYTSTIKSSYVDEDVYHVEIDFSFRGHQRACGDALAGSSALWQALAETPKVKLEPIQKSPVTGR